MSNTFNRPHLILYAICAALTALHFLAPRLQAGAANTTLTPILIIDAESSGAQFGTLDSCMLDSSGNLLVTHKCRMVIHVLDRFFIADQGNDLVRVFDLNNEDRLTNGGVTSSRYLVLLH